MNDGLGSSEWEKVDLEAITSNKKQEETSEQDERKHNDNIVSCSQLVNKIARKANGLNHKLVNAINDFTSKTKLSISHVLSNWISRAYDQQNDCACDNIPLQDQRPAISEGECTLRVNSTNMHTVLSANAHYNLITKNVQKKLGLTCHDVTG